MLTQLIFCKRSVPKPNKVAHLRSPSEPNYYIPQRDGTPQQSSHDCVLDCVGTEKLKYYTEHLEWESKVEGTMVLLSVSVQFSSVQFSRVQMFETPWTAACQASLSMTNSQSLLKFMSMESVMPSNHLILLSPSPPTFNLSRIKVFFLSQLFTSGGQSVGVSASASVLNTFQFSPHVLFTLPPTSTSSFNHGSSSPRLHHLALPQVIPSSF